MKGPIKVVLIDDDTKSRQPVAEFLREEAGFIVREYSRGEKALAFLVNHWENYTAVITDYLLGGSEISGSDFLEKMRQDIPYLPVIVFSGQDQESMKTLAQGAYATMQKPLSPAELVQLVEDLAEQDTIFQRMTEDVRNLLSPIGFDACLTWRLDRKKQKFHPVAWTKAVDKNYRGQVRLSARDSKWKGKYKGGFPRLIGDLKNPADASGFRYRKEVLKRGWRSLITIPLVYKGRIVGLIDSFGQLPFQFPDKNEEKETVDRLRAFSNQAVQAIRAANLSRNGRAVIEINQNLSATFDQQAILDSIVSKAVELTGADFGWIYLQDFADNTLHLKSFYGVESKHLDVNRTLEEGITGWVAKNEKGDFKLVPDVQEITDPELKHKPTPGKKESSAVAVPLQQSRQRERGKRTTIGVLTVKSPWRAHFTADDIDLLTSLAAVATAVIERIKLTEHLQEVSRLALDETKYAELEKYIVEAAQDLAGADVNFWRMSERENEGDHYLRIVASAGDFKEPYRESHLPTRPGSCVLAQALEEGEPVILADIFDKKNSPPFQQKKEAKAHGWNSFMAVPVIGQDEEKIGVLSLYGRMLRMFDKNNEGKLMETFANQAAIAFQQQQRMATTQKLAKVGHDLGMNTGATQELLRKVVEISQEITRANCTVLFPYNPVKQDYFNRELMVATGLRNYSIELTEKPRRTGLAAEINRYEILIVNNVEPLEFIAGNGKGLSTEDNRRIAKIFRKKPKIIQAENIQALVGASLFVKKHGTAANLDREKVGIIYFNYRHPRHFSSNELKSIRILTQHLAAVIHSNWLFEKAQQQNQELDALYRTGIDLSTRLDIKELAGKTLDELKKVIGYKKATIQLIRKLNLPRELLSFRGFPDDEINPKLLGPVSEDPLIKSVIADGEPRICSDVDNCPDWKFNEETKDVRSWAGVPLFYDEEAVGLLTLDHTQEGYYREEHAKLLSLFAGQVAVAIHNARLITDLKNRSRQLEQLHQAAIKVSSRPVASREDLKEVLTSIVESVRELFSVDSATIFPYYAVKNEFWDGVRAGVGIDELGAPPSSGLANRVIESKLSTYHNAEALKKEKELRIGNKLVRSSAWIPLLFNNEGVGVLFVNYFTDHEFTEEEKALIELFAQQAAVAIQNAMHQVLLRRRKMEAYQSEFNPYVVGPPIENPDQFFGREQVIQNILDSVHNNHFILHGERRIGKTSLLHQLERHLATRSEQDGKEYRFFPVVATLQGIESEAFFRFLMSRISRSFIWSAYDIDVDGPTFYDAEEFIDDFLLFAEHIREKWLDQKIRVVLLLDEADRFVAYDPETHERFRAILQGKCGDFLRVIMAGVNVHQVQETRTSPWYNMMKPIEVLPMNDQAARRLIVEPVLRYYTFTEEAIEYILRYSDLIPMEIQRLCDHATRQMLARVKKKADRIKPEAVPAELVIQPSDVGYAQDLTIKDKDGEYRNLWDKFTPDQQQRLLALAQNDEPILVAGGKRPFKKEDLHNIAFRHDHQHFKLTYLFTNWLLKQDR